jgi:RHS repeat-associated protein
MVSYFENSGGTLASSSFSIRHGFAGRELDESLALFYSRSRWYDPSAGRFPQRTFDSTNMYNSTLALGTVAQDPSAPSPKSACEVLAKTLEQHYDPYRLMRLRFARNNCTFPRIVCGDENIGNMA